MEPKQIIQTLTIGLLLILVTGCGMFSEEATPEPIAVDAVTQPDVVSAEAFVVPIREADLAFEAGGRVTTLEVEEGDVVDEGALLAELDNASQQATVAEAQARLAETQANLADVKAGATPEELDQAAADLARAEAVLAERLAGPTKEEIAEAETKVQTAQAELNNVLAGSRDEEVQAAASALMKAEAEVRIKQADYDKNVYAEPKVAEPYGIALQKATLDYEKTKADYDKLVNGATDEEIAIARARVREAQATLARVGTGATPEQIAQAQADVLKAQAALAKLKAGATDEKIAIAEAQVASAEAGINSAQTQLQKAQINAPFEGQIGMVDIEVGEMAQAGANLIALGDTSTWRIETDDLTEIDVVEVRPGASVTISVDALPDDEYKGEVIRITPKSETKAGDVTYTVLIEITEGDTSKLRWGMTTFVDIEIGPEL